MPCASTWLTRAVYAVALQSGPRGELQKVNQLRQEKIKEKKALRDRMGSMKRVDVVSRCVWGRGRGVAVELSQWQLQLSLGFAALRRQRG